MLQEISQKANTMAFAKLIDKGVIKRSRRKRPFVVVERLGPSLRDFLENIKINLKLKDIIKLGIGLIEKTKQLHELGIVHCDIKPDNILLAFIDDHLMSIVDDENLHNQEGLRRNDAPQSNNGNANEILRK